MQIRHCQVNLKYSHTPEMLDLTSERIWLKDVLDESGQLFLDTSETFKHRSNPRTSSTRHKYEKYLVYP